MTQLSSSELLALTMLTEYKDSLPQGATVEDIVKELSNNPGAFSSDTSSEREIRDFFGTVQKMVDDNPRFGQYRLVDYDKGSDSAPIATFVNGDDVVVAYWGTTGAREWKDNVLGGIEENGTYSQQQAMDYIRHVTEDLGLTGITVTGHSKGANKAQYVALLSDYVDECVCFDGQGFSADFVEKHRDEIEKNSGKITVISSQYDIVNALLIDVAGTRLYVDCSDVPDYYLTDSSGRRQMMYYHKPAVLLDSEGHLRNTDGVMSSPVTQLVYDYSTYMTRIEDKELRNKMFVFVAEIVSELLDPANKSPMDVKVQGVIDRLLKTENAETVAGFLAYSLAFLNEENMSLDALSTILGDAGVDVSAFNTKSNATLWELVLSIENGLGTDKTIETFTTLGKWCQDHGCNNWADIAGQAGELLLDFNNAESLAAVLAQVFEFCEERNLSYDEFVQLLKDYGISNEFFDSPYAPILWDALFDASREVSADEFVSLVNSITAWSEKKGLKSWDELLDYIKDDPVRLLDLYAYCGPDSKAVNKAIVKLLSPENLAALVAAFAKEHPFIAGVASVAVSLPVVRGLLETAGVLLTTVGTIYLIANHIIKNWDSIKADIVRTVEEIKAKVGKFFSDVMQLVKEKISELIDVVTTQAMALIENVKGVVHTVADGVRATLGFVKDAAIKGINRVLNYGRGIVYGIASRLLGEPREPIRINYYQLRDCVERMEAVAHRVAVMDKRLDALYARLMSKDVEQEKGVFTSLVNLYHLMRADIAVDEGQIIRRRAQAISGLFGDYNSLEQKINGLVPPRLK